MHKQHFFLSFSAAPVLLHLQGTWCGNDGSQKLWREGHNKCHMFSTKEKQQRHKQQQEETAQQETGPPTQQETGGSQNRLQHHTVNLHVATCNVNSKKTCVHQNMC